MKEELSVKEVRAMYFDESALRLSPIPLYRYEHKGDRFYYYQVESEKLFDTTPEIRFAAGVTTITRKTIPQDEFLIKWMAQMGYDEAIAYRNERASYGSLMHTCIATLMITKTFNVDYLSDIVHNYCLKNSLKVNEERWADDLRQDVLAFAQFVKDYQVQPLAVELSLVSPSLGVAGTLDLLCTMTVQRSGFFGEVYKSGEKKGEPKETKKDFRVFAIIDFKSGRESTGGVHNAAQLALLKLLLRHNYSEFADQEINLFNWHPKNWRTAPTYTLVDQNNGFPETAVLPMITMYQLLNKSPEDKTRLDIFGIINLNDPKLEENYKITPIKTIVEESISEGKTEEMKYDYADFYFNFEDEGGES